MAKNKTRTNAATVPLQIRLYRLLFTIYFNTFGRIFRKAAAARALKIFLTPTRSGLSPERQAYKDQASAASIEVEAQAIQTYSWGEAGRPGVLLVHGWGGSGVSLGMFAAPLIEKGYRVYGFDGFAHGESPGRSTNMLEHAKVIHAMLEAFPETEAIICHSFGGAAAIYSLGHYPDHPIKSVAAIASPTRMNQVMLDFMKVFSIPTSLLKIMEKQAYERYGLTFSALNPEHWMAKCPDTRFLFIHDKEDRSVPFNDAEYLHQKYPHTTLIRTNGLGHNKILWDQQVKDDVINFIVSEHN